MNVSDLGNRLLARLNPRVAAAVEKAVRKAPFVRDRLEREYERLLAGMEAAAKAYRGAVPTFARLPTTGRGREVVLEEMQGLEALEEGRWKEGFVSGGVYHGDAGHIDFLNHVYALN